MRYVPRGATTAEKLRDQGLGPNTEALVPRARPKTGLGVGCGRESLPPAVKGPGISPPENFENSDAKSCILVTTVLISRIPRTYICEQTTLLVPQPNSWGASLPGPYGCCAYFILFIYLFSLSDHSM